MPRQSLRRTRELTEVAENPVPLQGAIPGFVPASSGLTACRVVVRRSHQLTSRRMVLDHMNAGVEQLRWVLRRGDGVRRASLQNALESWPTVTTSLLGIPNGRVRPAIK